ncbi:hypothetical protein M405DRAFT_865430 [Rhizopogon salebrosus TDB-379]|nr:hypothetical protein M405DRAFT_865430 [Rhizopogon salebrosus TDB-379]
MVLGRTGKRPRNRTGLTSARIRHVVSHRETAARGIAPTLEVLGPRKIAEHAAGAAARKKACLAVLTSEEKQVLEALREPHDVDGNNFSGDEDFGFGVLDGSEMVDISHAGGEFHELTREVLGDFWNQ